MRVAQLNEQVATGVLRLHHFTPSVFEATRMVCAACRQPYPCETVQVVETITNQQ